MWHVFTKQETLISQSIPINIPDKCYKKLSTTTHCVRFLVHFDDNNTSCVEVCCATF